VVYMYVPSGGMGVRVGADRRWVFAGKFQNSELLDEMLATTVEVFSRIYPKLTENINHRTLYRARGKKQCFGNFAVAESLVGEARNFHFALSENRFLLLCAADCLQQASAARISVIERIYSPAGSSSSIGHRIALCSANGR